MSKIVVITGGTSGLGEAMAKAFASENNIVYATGRNLTNKKSSASLNYLYLDVTKQESITTAVEQIISKHGRIDVLVNNAGIGIASSVEEIKISEVQNAFDVNLFGTIRLIQAIVPQMRTQGKGTIINISSIAGQIGLPFQGIYSATKYALEGMTEALRMELKPFGINVCLVEPGDYNTKVNINRTKHIPEPNSPHYKRLTHFFGIIDKNIETGRNPKKLANLAIRISKKKSPKLRYRSGRIFETITPFVHWVTPTCIFERVLNVFYKL